MIVSLKRFCRLVQDLVEKSIPYPWKSVKQILEPLIYILAYLYLGLKLFAQPSPNNPVNFKC